MSGLFTSRTRIFSAAAVVALAGAALSGCAGAPGAAVEGTITDAEGTTTELVMSNETLVETLNAMSNLGIDTDNVINAAAFMPALEPILAEHDISVTSAEEISASINQEYEDAGMEISAEAVEEMTQVVQWNQAMTAFQSLDEDEYNEIVEEFNEATADTDVNLSLRFQTFPWMLSTDTSE